MREAALDALRDDPRDPFSVAVALLAVLTTVVAAGVGILFATSSNRAEEAASEAMQRTLHAASQSDRSAQETDRALRLLEQRTEAAARAQYARERLLLGAGTQAVTLEREGARWARRTREADRSLHQLATGAGLTDISSTGSGAPDRESWFPFELRARAQHDGVQQTALRDAANAESSAWGKRSASYTAILTLLAVALYLFGFALTPQGHALRGLFASVGVAFLALCIIFGPVRALSSPERAPRDAAEAYADGFVAFQVAGGPSGYEAAANAFSSAIELRPSFAEAYIDRAQARFYADTPQQVSFASLTSPPALAKATRDLRMGRELGIRTSTVLGDLGFYLFESALLEGDLELLEESVELTRKAVEADAQEPVYRFNLGVSLLASGEIEQARDAYLQALHLTPRGYSFWGPASGALTDLELVTRYGPAHVIDDAQAMRELIIGWRDNEAREGRAMDAVIWSASASVDPGFAEFYIHRSQNLEAGDVVDAHWYHLEPGGLSWSHMEQISGYRLPLNPQSDGALGYYIDYPTAARACLPSGRYRVDLYHRGTLLGQAETTYDGEFESLVNHAAGVVGCLPPSWRPNREASGAVRSYLSPDRKRGLLLIRLDSVDPPPFIDRKGEARAMFRNVLSIVGDRIPPPVRYLGSSRAPWFNGSFPRLRYSFAGGEALAGVATDTDGSLVGALAFGPRGFLAGDPSTPTRIVSSLGLLTTSAARER